MIIVGVLDVLASEVECVLKRHDAVADAAVIASKDPLRGEIVKAYVELAPNADVTEQELIEYARGVLEPFKVPRKVVFVDELPRTSTGKIAKWCLEEVEP